MLSRNVGCWVWKDPSIYVSVGSSIIYILNNVFTGWQLLWSPFGIWWYSAGVIWNLFSICLYVPIVSDILFCSFLKCRNLNTCLCCCVVMYCLYIRCLHRHHFFLLMQTGYLESLHLFFLRSECHCSFIYNNDPLAPEDINQLNFRI